MLRYYNPYSYYSFKLRAICQAIEIPEIQREDQNLKTSSRVACKISHLDQAKKTQQA